jgi:type II protein arginine methyltransferase
MFRTKKRNASTDVSRKTKKGKKEASISNESDGETVAIGYEIPVLSGEKQIYSLINSSLMNFITSPIAVSTETNSSRNIFAVNELSLNAIEWNSFVIGKLKISKDIESNVLNEMLQEENRLQREYSYANHLGLQAVIIDISNLTTTNSYTNLSRFIHFLSIIHKATSPQIWIQIPAAATILPNDNDNNNNNNNSLSDTWEIWDTIRHRIDHDPKIHIALTFPSLENLEILNHFELRCAQWIAEPLQAIYLSTNYFFQSKSNTQQLKLSKKITTLLTKWYFSYKLHYILYGELLEGFELIDYRHCLWKVYTQYLQTKGPLSLQEKFNQSYEDILETPLDPLQVNLDANTYRIMEQDPIKYQQYELALITRLLDLKKQFHHHHHHQEEEEQTSSVSSSVSISISLPIIRILVIGPGRGPLIESSLVAAAVTKLPCQIIAIEKNKNAVNTIAYRFRHHNNVEIIFGDVRKVIHDKQQIASQSIDIIVSELLGSLGDNEAAPECLIYAQSVLKENGIMIPQQYTSYVAPISCSKLWNNARNMFLGSLVSTEQIGLDYPYVVHLHSYAQYGGDAKALFTFQHPDPHSAEGKEEETQQVGNRYTTIEFEIETSTTLHGLGGYFDCCLYGDISFSTVPHNHSVGMFSWFPMFLPFQRPIRVNPHDRLSITIWRRVTTEKMWYEWMVTSPIVLGLQNSAGRSFSIHL